MTPKEKAEELYEAIRYEIDWEIDSRMNGYVAKQCALIAVDEILNENCFAMFGINRKDYWQEVRNEIEKL